MLKIHENLKLIGVIVLTFCAVFVCTIFVNYNIDLKDIAGLISDPKTQAIYEGSLTMNRIIIGCAGGILALMTMLVLVFAINRYISENQANMGVLKALGYNDMRIALPFCKFGLSVLIGAGLAYLSGSLSCPAFYKLLDSAGELPKISAHFHIEGLLILVIAPFLFFSVLSAMYALLKLRKQPLSMIKEHKDVKVGRLTKKLQSSKKERPYLKDLSRTILFNNLLLILFVGFASLAFSAQMQLAFSVSEITPGLTFSVMLIAIGLILGTVTLIIALSFVINANKKYLAFMKSFGYTNSECNRAVFGGYRIISYIGFLAGTGYQILLSKLIFSIFASSYDNLPVIGFDLKAFFITLAVFIAAYELIMLLYKQKVKKISLRELMQS